MNLENKDYVEAIKFVLNFPPEGIVVRYYSEEKDVWVVDVLDGGWYTIKLNGDLIRSAAKWKGKTWEGN